LDQPAENVAGRPFDASFQALMDFIVYSWSLALAGI
jgi:hypothetical protein